jgi:AraC-like DNA-binding protein
MKAQLHKLPLISDSSFLFNRWDCNYFDKPWHFHEEYELVLIDKSRGTKFIGDNVSHFEAGDLFLIGSNIPHLFRNQEDYYAGDPTLEASSIFIHFTGQFLGSNFFDLPEMRAVKKLLDQAAFALEINGKAKEMVICKLYEMCSENASQRLLSLLEILLKLSENNDQTPLLSYRFTPPATTNTKDTDRIHKVFEFIMKNFTQEIYVPEIAEMLNMSSASFSRYFKHHTRKTFSGYVTEIRISHACQLLMQGDESVSQIGYMSGFENLSNFYRHFREIIGLTPKEYRHRFLRLAE